MAFDLSLEKMAKGMSRSKRPSKKSLKIAHLLHLAGLIDIWRELNPHMKDYTHFSAPHNTYARIDHIFTQSTSIPLTLTSKIKDTALSDHSIVTLLTQQSPGSEGPFKWLLYEALLSDPIQCTILEQTLKDYFIENDNDSVSPATLWAAHKTVMRDKLTQLSSKLKRQHIADLQRGTEEFRSLAKAHK